MRFFSLFLAFLEAAVCYAAFSRRAAEKLVIPRQELLQDIVTWDKYSLKIKGERVLIYSGEVHPYRMPVHSLYLDVFQKMKSMGMNTVSIYVFWGILEPKRGEVSFEGFRDLQPFLDAAKQAGLYVIARPGPYINAETTAGGFPGWGTYTPGLWRTSNSTYIDAYQLYLKSVGEVFVKNEITKGGPVILFQAENEYTYTQSPYTEDFEYEKILLQNIRDIGVTVPIIHNDADPAVGSYTSVDIWGYDRYPHGFDCSRPYVWGANSVPQNFWSAHMAHAPEDPNAIFEFQGGAFDGWGGAGFENCAILTGPEFGRVFYKNNYASSTTIFNIYMIYGGTNWGGISHPQGYTSYDYGAAIREERSLREKYYEIKLQANFLKATPAFLTSRPINSNATAGAFTGNSALRTTQLLDEGSTSEIKTGFYIVRQANASSFGSQEYKLSLPTSAGTLNIPAFGGSLKLTGRDSKIHVTDYKAGSTDILYSTAEILTWATVDGKDVILVYGNKGEVHETAIKTTEQAVQAQVVGGDDAVKQRALSESSALALQYTTNGQTVVQIGTKTVLYILDRETAYQFWVLHAPSKEEANYNTKDPLIIKGGYFLRSVSTQGGSLNVRGDLNETASFEFLTPAALTKSVTFNGEKLALKKTAYGTYIAQREAKLPKVKLPDLSALKWKSADSLPEISAKYSDDKWTTANKNSTVNPTRPKTPAGVVLYAGDYGYHTGNIIWRAHFKATGSETGFRATVQGGAAFGFNVWLDTTFIGSWEGDNEHASYNGTYSFPSRLTAGSSHVITILQDHMGYDEDFVAASDTFKAPRGIIGYEFVNSPSTVVDVWKVQGNLGGEEYADKTRGPLNEGGLYAERQGWHLPGFDDSKWASSSPYEGISTPGVAFYRSTFTLDIPKGVDYPIAITVSNSTSLPHYRSQFYVNGYQFGKYANAIGPQKSFPIPQGVLNYNGENTIGISLWAHDKGGAKLDALSLKVLALVETSMASVVPVPQPKWQRRSNAV